MRQTAARGTFLERVSVERRPGPDLRTGSQRGALSNWLFSFVYRSPPVCIDHVNLRCTLTTVPRTLSPVEIESFRSDLCRVATQQFAEAGYDGVTLRGLAGELGVSPMTPYRYFENKEAIFESVRAAAFDRFGDFTARTREATEALPPLEQLRAMGRSYVEFAVAEPHAYRIMFELDHLSNTDDAFLEESRARCWAQILAVCERCVRASDLVGDPLLVAHLSWVTLHGLVTLHLSGKLQVGLTLEDLLEPTLQSILRGAAPTPPDVGASP